ncbi:serine/threonine protein kinase [Podospora conica]|nr:serine/threonine protein kinase [Schizothecium conicum]
MSDEDDFDQYRSRGLPNILRHNTIEQSSRVPFSSSGLSIRGVFGPTNVPWSKNIPRLSKYELWQLSKLHKDSPRKDADLVTSISSFMAAVADVNPPFKPRTLHRPWSISAGNGAHGTVEVHRYVPARNFNVFNDSSSLKLLAYEPDPTRTGDYYAVKRLQLLKPAGKEIKDKAQPKRNPYALLADELRILAHPDLRGHQNIVYLFGVSHTPSWGRIDSAEPNLVLQEGDCGSLFSLYRDVHMGFDRHTLVEVKLSLCFDIASGLEALHRHGVVHCDLKPENILIRRRSGRHQPVMRCESEIEAGQVALQSLMGESPFVAMLADFGGSVIMADQPGDKAYPGVMTYLWCAPECYPNTPIAKSLLPRVDIYSAGLVFAFIFLEGRSIFTQVVERGLVHQYDTTLDREAVRSKKTTGTALALALEQVRGMESSVFGITATGERLYMSRDQCYPPVVSDIFASILGLALQADPSKRVANATDLLEPWHRALQGDFHVRNSLHYSQPAAFRSFSSGRLGGKDYFSSGKTCVKPAGQGCAQVPRLFSNSDMEFSPGVFDIRKSFKVFRASLTSPLKTAIIDDMMQEVGRVRSVKGLEVVGMPSTSQLRRAAGCAYQASLACLEGFGCLRDDQEALERMRTAAEWGLPVAQTDFLPLAVSLGADLDKNDPWVEWAVNSVINKQAHQGTVNALWHVNQDMCTDAVSKYRVERSKKIQVAFELRMSVDWEELRRSGEWKTKLTQLHKASLGIGGMMKTIADGGWSLLHYVVALMPDRAAVKKMLPMARRGFLENLGADVRFLVDEQGVDVRLLNEDSATALDLAMAHGDTSTVWYLLERHQRCKPPFLPGSCPLQNVACLPAELIDEVIEKVCKIAPEMGVDARLPSTGRTALLNTLLTKEPLLPPARKAASMSLLEHGANPLLTTAEPGTASPLLLAVAGVEPDLVRTMLFYIKKFGHGLPLLSSGMARPEPANELARAFLRLVQTPRSVSLAKGIVGHRQSLGAIIKTMLGHGACSELPYACRGMPHDLLGLACYYGRDDVMQAILAESNGVGPAVEKTLSSGGDSGVMALKTAVDCGSVKAVDLLLPYLAKLPGTITDRDLLLSGAMHHQPALVLDLLGHFERAFRGPEVLEFRDQWGATILDLALEYGYFELARQLLAKGAKYDVYRLKGDHSVDDGPQSTLASVLPRMKPIELLMELTPKPRLIVTSTGLNVFHILAANETLIDTTVGRAEFLQVLEYFHGLDPTLIHARGGTRGITPFHVVSLYYSETVGEFLHAHGADINAASDDGRHTPLDLLHFHDNGDRGPEEHLTVDYRTSGAAPRTGVAICDYAMAGPVYWKLEDKLLARMKELYKTWGAKRGLQNMMRTLGLGGDLGGFFSGGITAYYTDENGVERSNHFS